MRYIATLFLVLMTIILVVCGILLWRKRKETNDYSRTIQAILSWMSAFFSFTFIFRTWTETTTADGDFFEPEHTFVPIFIQMIFFLYPLEVIRPTIGRTLAYTLLFSPLLLVALIGICSGIEYTPIHTDKIIASTGGSELRANAYESEISAFEKFWKVNADMSLEKDIIKLHNSKDNYFYKGGGIHYHQLQPVISNKELRINRGTQESVWHPKRWGE